MNDEKSDHNWLADFNYINYSVTSITACSNPALFNVEGIPSTFIFDEKGDLVKRTDGRDEYNGENTALYRSKQTSP